MTWTPRNEAINKYVKPLMMEAIEMGEHLGLQDYQYYHLLKELLKEVERDGE